MEFLIDLNTLPEGARLYLYGAGEGGSYIGRLLNAHRPDIAILGFIDSYKRGFLDGYPIRSLDGHMKACGDDSGHILVASIYWKDIASSLSAAGIEDFTVLHPDIVSPGWLFSREERLRWQKEIEQATALFERSADRTLYALLIEARTELAHGALKTVFDYWMKTRPESRGQYLDHINLEAPRILIEGGVCDGLNTLDFLARMPNLEHIYGFEPFYQAFDDQLLSTFVNLSDKVSILPQALWDKCGKVCMTAGPHGTSRVGADGMEVTAITLDEFRTWNALPSIDFIKLDVEGAEPNVLAGACETIQRDRPQLAISIYHHKRHLFEIPLWLAQHLGGYRYRLGHYSPGFSETILYAIPEELAS